MNHLSLSRVCASVIILSVCAGVQAGTLTPLQLTPFWDRTRVNPGEGLYVNYTVTSGSGGTSGTGLLSVESGAFGGGFTAKDVPLWVDLDNDATQLYGNTIDQEAFSTVGMFRVSVVLNWDTAANTVAVDAANAANAITVTADLDPATNAPGDLGVETLFHVNEAAGQGRFLLFGAGTDELEFTFENGIDLTAIGLPDMVLDRVGGLILDTGAICDDSDSLLKDVDERWQSEFFADDFSNATQPQLEAIGTPLGSAIIFIPEPSALTILGLLGLSAATRRRR